MSRSGPSASPTEWMSDDCAGNCDTRDDNASRMTNPVSTRRDKVRGREREVDGELIDSAVKLSGACPVAGSRELSRAKVTDVRKYLPINRLKRGTIATMTTGIKSETPRPGDISAHINASVQSGKRQAP